MRPKVSTPKLAAHAESADRTVPNRRPPRKFGLAVLAAMLFVAALPGCAIMDIGVTNPVPGLSTVAIAPFINLSHERAVDGRRFALAYFSELQKVPGFEVLPVGVTEAVIVENDIHLNSPDDVLKLAKLLNVDAVVVGAVTDYNPYYPPRIGLQVEWYSPHPVAFYPGIQIEPQTREQFRKWDEAQLEEWRRRQKEAYELRSIEDHWWERCWWKFKRLPGIRKLAGEPTWVLNERPQTIIRAQSEEELPRVMTNQETDLSSRIWRPENARVGWIERAGTSTANVPQNVVPVRPIVTERVIVPPQAFAPTDEATELKVPALNLPQTSPQTSSNPPALSAQAPDAPKPDSLLPPAVPAEKPSTPVSSAPSAAPNAPLETPGAGRVPPPPPPAPLDEAPGSPAPASPAPQSTLPPSQSKGTDPVIPETFAPPEGPVAAPILPIRDPALAPLPPQPNPYNVVQPIQPWQLDPRLPFMSYTRMFDGADADLAAALRDYVELTGDLRSGGWEAYMHRSDDFIKFTAHLMISEMLALHGGEGRHRIVIKPRKFMYPLGIGNL